MLGQGHVEDRGLLGPRGHPSDPAVATDVKKMRKKLKFPQLLQVDLPPSQGPESQHQIRMSLSQNQGILQVTARILGLKQSKIACMCMLIFPFPWSHMVAWFIPQTARGSLTFRFLGTFFSACCFWAVSMAWRSCGLFSGQLKSGDSRIEKRYIMAYNYRINVNCKLRQDIPECESTLLSWSTLSILGIPTCLWFTSVSHGSMLWCASQNSQHRQGKTWHSTASSRAPWTNWSKYFSGKGTKS